MNNNIHLLAEGLRFPEGPTFDESGNLWCVEQEGEGLFCRLADGSTKRVHTGGRPNGAVYHQNYLWFCDSGTNTIKRLNTSSEEIEIIISHVGGQPLNMPNDLLFDKENNLIITCPGSPDDGLQGYVVVYSPDATAQVIADGLSYPNGLAFLSDNETLLIAETHQQRIWSGYWDVKSLSWETIRVWTSVIEAPDDAQIPGPDGMTLGPDGNLYVAIFGAGIIRVFSDEGEFIRDIKLPGQNPSNCIFDPSGKLGLVVTETEKGELWSVMI